MAAEQVLRNARDAADQVTETERADSLQHAQTKPMKTLADSLDACKVEFRSDKFWSDMAKPIDKCYEYFANMKAAATPEEATEERRKAM